MARVTQGRRPLAGIVGLAIWLSLCGCDGKDGAVAADAPAPGAGTPVDRRTDLQAAFFAVYGYDAPYTGPKWGGCTPLVREAGALVRLADQYVLLVPSYTPDDLHPCAGPFSIHYLRKSGDRFQVVRSWADHLPGSSHGGGGVFRVRTDLFTYPAVEKTGGGTWQGVDCDWLQLVELTPAGPVIRLRMDDEFDDDDGQFNFEPGDPNFVATVEPGERDRTLRVRYVWDKRRVENITLVRDGETYRPQGGAVLPKQC